MLVRNDGTLPLDAPAVIAVIGPNADDPYAMLGCYSFPTHVVSQHPGVELGIAHPDPARGAARRVPDERDPLGARHERRRR